MTSLLDIAELSDKVTIRGVTLTLTGITAEGIAALLREFPELRIVMAGTQEMKNDAIGILMSKAPEAVASVIAAGAGMPGDKAAIKKVQNFTIGEQMECLEPIFSMTFPKGPRDFIEALTRLADVMGVRNSDDTGKAADTK